jgi:hypothetical protein
MATATPAPHEDRPAAAEEAAPTPSLPAAEGPRRPARYGITIQFDERPGDAEPGRLVESTVWVNTAHPDYRRAVASRSEGYHVALAAALALARVVVEPADEHAFLSAFLARWGAVVDGARSRRHVR